MLEQMDLQERRYQVFISSTFRDLVDERKLVLDAILELRAFPSGMEMFPSADDEQWEFIKREIDSSDYYVLIVAGKYGSIAPDGISYTEKEYDYAVAQKKPVHAFLYKDLGNLKGSQLENDAQKSESLDLFRTKVATGKLVRFYEHPHELKAQVLQALVNAFNFRPAEGWVRARNSRRLEDLEQISQLQQELRRLETAIAELRRDPTEGLAQGSDPLELTFKLTPTHNHIAHPPQY